MTLEQNARRALRAFVNMEAREFGPYRVEPRGDGYWAIHSYGVPFHLGPDGLAWWASRTMDTADGINATLRRLVEELAGVELEPRVHPAFVLVLGPLGLAALRAALTTTVEQQQ